RIGPFKRNSVISSTWNPEFTRDETPILRALFGRSAPNAKNFEPPVGSRDSLEIAMTKPCAVASVSLLSLLATASCTSTSAQPGDGSAAGAAGAATGVGG